MDSSRRLLKKKDLLDNTRMKSAHMCFTMHVISNVRLQHIRAEGTPYNQATYGAASNAKLLCLPNGGVALQHAATFLEKNMSALSLSRVSSVMLGDPCAVSLGVCLCSMRPLRILSVLRCSHSCVRLLMVQLCCRRQTNERKMLTSFGCL